MVAVDYSRCNQCGCCVIACPVQAIEGALPGRKVVGDRLYADFNSVPTVKELLLYYHDNCCRIAVPNEESVWINAVAQANQILERLSLPPFTIEFDPSIVNECICRPRRSFLRLDFIGHRLTKPTMVNLPLGQHMPDYQFFNVTLNRSDCTLCSACLRLCPASAIKYEKQHLVIENGRCVGCKLCRDGCPEGALQVTDSVAPKTVSAYPFIAHCCVDCKKSFLSVAENSTLCAACRLKKALGLTGPRAGIWGLNGGQQH